VHDQASRRELPATADDCSLSLNSNDWLDTFGRPEPDATARSRDRAPYRRRRSHPASPKILAARRREFSGSLATAERPAPTRPEDPRRLPARVLRLSGQRATRSRPATARRTGARSARRSIGTAMLAAGLLLAQVRQFDRRKCVGARTSAGAGGGVCPYTRTEPGAFDQGLDNVERTCIEQVARSRSDWTDESMRDSHDQRSRDEKCNRR
jgi:hypothetical protein